MKAGFPPLTLPWCLLTDSLLTELSTRAELVITELAGESDCSDLIAFVQECRKRLEANATTIAHIVEDQS